MPPASWFGALVIFFLPWIDIRCIKDNGEVTSRITMSGAELVCGGATDRTERPERTDPQPDDPDVRIQIAPDAIKQVPNPKEIAGRCLLACYSLLLLVCLAFVAVRPGIRRAWAGTCCSLILLVLLLAGNWLLLKKSISPPEPSRSKIDVWFVVNYTPWYYASYLLNLAALLWFGIELWIILRLRRTRGTRATEDTGGCP